ncbi:hypothetical protein VP01_313g1 [Puccinia sorghi]|uniref:Uncharacterized protein n=1 Tax=Puccinia sorghi TaxID=27349 RepID=A0A0L6UYY3_9BASI|nr:hypothetical protein VP01_313g1 [Puccinia sorghi]
MIPFLTTALSQPTFSSTYLLRETRLVDQRSMLPARVYPPLCWLTSSLLETGLKYIKRLRLRSFVQLIPLTYHYFVLESLLLSWLPCGITSQADPECGSRRKFSAEERSLGTLSGQAEDELVDDIYMLYLVYIILYITSLTMPKVRGMHLYFIGIFMRLIGKAKNDLHIAFYISHQEVMLHNHSNRRFLSSCHLTCIPLTLGMACCPSGTLMERAARYTECRSYNYRHSRIGRRANNRKFQMTFLPPSSIVIVSFYRATVCVLGFIAATVFFLQRPNLTECAASDRWKVTAAVEIPLRGCCHRTSLELCTLDCLHLMRRLVDAPAKSTCSYLDVFISRMPRDSYHVSVKTVSLHDRPEHPRPFLGDPYGTIREHDFL